MNYEIQYQVRYQNGSEIYVVSIIVDGNHHDGIKTTSREEAARYLSSLHLLIATGSLNTEINLKSY